ncbi:Eukaryotic translation initiation factor 4E [Diplonema papillatum]|nr:Eukaryotic translation initiation factor 4E [Diplonema papillatum]
MPSRLSADAPSWSPTGAQQKQPGGDGGGKAAAAPGPKAPPAAVSKRFAFSGAAKPFTPPSVVFAAAASTPPAAAAAAANHATTTDAKSKPPLPETSPSPAAQFPSQPIASLASSASSVDSERDPASPPAKDGPGAHGPGRPSRLTASAAPFTPKSMLATPTSQPPPSHAEPPPANPATPNSQPSPSNGPAAMLPRYPSFDSAPHAHLDPTAKEFIPGSARAASTGNGSIPSGNTSPASTPSQQRQAWKPSSAVVGPSIPLLSPQSPPQPRDLSAKHKLFTTWTLWYTSGRKPDSSADWKDGLKSIFDIADVETFWGVLDHTRAPSALEKGATYYLFRKDIKPAWEDATCRRGGEWKMWLPPGRKLDIDSIWILLTLQCIGEQYAHSDDVCGVAVETRAKGDRVALWTKTTEKARTMAIGREFKRVLAGSVPAEQPLCFTSHTNALCGNEKDASYFLAD